ncbi:MAG: 2-hydroxyacyl-CoA dehydratase family protein [Verrucomicrobia bacterium]|nr:2-hydroxyacyl-CoA dehydratase family protein [Verrucomicrobiota bacterium]
METHPAPGPRVDSRVRSRLALIGGPIPASIRHDLDEFLRTYGAAVLLDVTENNMTQHIPRLNSGRTTGDEFTILASRYFRIPAVWKRPNTAIYTWFSNRVRQEQIDGVLLIRYVFCDLWHCALHEFKHRLSIPILEMDLDGGEALSASAFSRVQAFLEMISHG